MGTAWGFGGASRDRTGDLYNAIVALSQLSYGPTLGTRKDRCTRFQRQAFSFARDVFARGHGRDALHEIQLIRDLACVMLAAGVVVVVFPRLRLPVLLGYILAGVLIGPHMPWRFLTDQHTMQSIANLGVVLLMFTLGLDSNLRKLRALGAGVMLAALVEVGFMLWLGIEIGRLAGLTGREALFLGGVICFSSTMIALRTVGDRGWRGQGFVAGMIGMLVSEEVLTVVLITVLSAIAAGSADTTDIAFVVLWRMLLFVAVALILGLLLLPRLLDWLAKRGRDEPLLVTALGI